MQPRHPVGRRLLALGAALALTSCAAPGEEASPTSSASVTAEAVVPTSAAVATPPAPAPSTGGVGDVDAVQAALEPLWPAFDVAADETGDFSTMTEGQRSVAFAWVLSGLVDNGGFFSWIESIGHRTPEAKAALAYLGATEYVPLLDQAMRLYPTYSGSSPDERLSAADRWTSAEEARAEALDEAFSELSAHKDLVSYYAAAYVAAHPEEFPG